MEVDAGREDLTDGVSVQSIIGGKGIKRFKLGSSKLNSQPVSCHMQEDNFSGTQEVNEHEFIETEEFYFPTTDPEKFRKSAEQTTIDEVMDIINTSNHQKQDSMATAELCPIMKRPRLTINKSQIGKLYGFEIDSQTHLFPEETLYLMETGKLQVLTGGVSLSTERGRLLFLHSTPNSNSTRREIYSCSTQEYSVYKYFSKLGYRLRRRVSDGLASTLSKPSQSEATFGAGVQSGSEGMNPKDVDTDMETVSQTGDSDLGQVEEEESTSLPHISSFRGMKRKANSPGDEEGRVEEEDSDCEFIEEVGNVSNKAGLDTDCRDITFGEELMEEESIPGPSSSIQSSCYFVVETDSDVEIVDEVVYSSVDIQELAGESESHYEAGPSTSTVNQVIVDLVSSEEEEDEPSDYEVIWSKCIPNTKFQLRFPPSRLLPENILPRDAPAVYEYNFNNQDESDLEIETIVDSLRLDASPQANSQSTYTSWKEWRQSAMTEARDILNESLLATSNDIKDINTKLHQWNCGTAQSIPDEENMKPNLSIPFDLFPLTASNVHKNKLGIVVKPTHHVAIVTETELIPDLRTFPSSEDETPILITIIGEDSTILHLLCNSAPLPSLF